MPKCVYCGEGAGLLKNSHPNCAKTYSSGRLAMTGLATEAVLVTKSQDTLIQNLQLIADSSRIPRHHIGEALFEGWDAAVDALLEKHLPTEEEERLLSAYLTRFELKGDRTLPGALRIVKSAALREVLAGRLPKPRNFGVLPFNFRSKETLIWAFPMTAYYERRTKYIRTGVSHGVSKRIMNGLYYSPRVFRSETTELNETKLVDNGTVAITDQNMYFSGDEKSLRIPYARIVSFNAHSEGISIVRDTATARPQIFVTGDGWFCYNLVTNLAARAA